MRGECPPNVAMVTDLFTIHNILPGIIMMMMGVALVTIPYYKVLLYQSLAMYKNC